MANTFFNDYPFLNDMAEWFIPTDDDYSLSAAEFRDHKTRIVDEIESLKQALGNKDRRGVIHHASTLQSLLLYSQLTIGIESLIRDEDKGWISYIITEVVAKRMEIHD